MKTIRLFYSMMLIALGISTSNLQAQVNLLTNGGFETWDNAAAAPDGWAYNINDVTLAVYNQTTGTPSTGEVTEGTKALAVISTNNSAVRINQTITAGIEPGESYTLSMKYKVTEHPNRGNATDGIRFTWVWYNAADEWLDGASSSTAFGSVSSALNVWLDAEENIIAPAGAAKLEIQIGITRQADAVYDDIRVRKVSSETPSLELSVATASFSASGESATVNVTSNTTWSAVSNASWLTLNPASGSNIGILTLTAAANTGAERTAMVTVSASGIADKTITVTQAAGSVTSPTGNLISNGSFETLNSNNEPSDWTFNGIGASIIIGTNNVSEGQNALQLSTTEGSGPSIEQIIDLTGMLTTGDEYTFSLNYKYVTASANTSEGGLNYAVAFMDADSNPIDPMIYVMGGTPATEGVWLPVNESITVPQNAVYLYLTLGVNYASTVIIDDIQLVKIENEIPNLELSVGTASFSAASESTTVDITANVDWTAVSNASWLTLNPALGSNNGILSLTADANTEAERRATVTVSASGVSDKTIVVTQAEATVVEPEVNFIANGDFETWSSGQASGWIANSDSYVTFSKEVTTVYEGSAAMRINVLSTSATLRSIFQIIGQTKHVFSIGQRHKLSFRYYVVDAGNNGEVNYTASWRGMDNTDESRSQVISATLDATVGQWHYFEVETTAPAQMVDPTWGNIYNIVSIEDFRLTIGGNKQMQLIVDDMRLVEIKGSTTGISDTKDKNFTLLTNPVSSEARFNFTPAAESASITIYDINGKVFAAENIPTMATETDISVSYLPKGIYIAGYKDASGKRAVVKLLK